MAELSGSLTSIPLHALVGLLTDLKKSGDALIVVDDWSACLSFESGDLIAAAIEQERGPSALDFVAAAMGCGEFRFHEGAPSLEPNLPAAGPVLSEHARPPLPAGLPGPDFIPSLVPGAFGDAADETSAAPLTRAAVAVLLDIDGQRCVRAITLRHGLLRTMRALVELCGLKLIALAPPPAPAAPSSAAPDARLAAPARVGQVVARLAGLRRRIHPRAIAIELGQAVFAAAVLIGVVHVLIQNFRVDGISMQPTFSSGEALIVDRTAYLTLDALPLRPVFAADRQSPGYVFGGPERGDIVVFRAPPQPDVDYIKRVIALPGESVLIQHQRVYVNGQLLDEPYVQSPADYAFPGDGQPVTIPAGTYFVLGDNRPDSFDSHTGWVVPAQYLIGRAWLRYWPPSAWGVVSPGH